ncbi:glycosyltransferase family 2 protein [Mucilaginibacter psychrotolerans]|uniref:Glycosyltransferase n=1 Tax=Mucilaginibacter psychrotolerans TaxID=1524096 RepID=A0A4Y8SPP2_9SPHI|nr:glycosyltransferase family 2 protein [Mucilaginibacter psychrotolerans]TFF40888.1 glycosyltransferase [Mucilaginibacter psychrotolerans]
MGQLKISIITVCYNAAGTLERCIKSVISQSYNNIEYIVIDGGSTDDSLTIINSFQHKINILITEPDDGIYDAMNKGIALATGDVVGMLNADDVFAGEWVISDIAAAFEKNNTDILYADLNYIKPDSIILRKWRSGAYKHGLFNKGWMPPHPTFYCKRNLFGLFGNYSLEYGTAADYELMVRFIHVNKASVFYLKKVVVNMFTGGVSNNSFAGRAKVLFLDLKAMRRNHINYPIIALLYKRLKKIAQFF